MQTFLPYKGTLKSAMSLDKKRCWKQVIEAKQIISILECVINTPPGGIDKSIPWRNHPAVKMWVGYEMTLKAYYNVFLDVCKAIHKINTSYIRYEVPSFDVLEKPWWLGNEDFHRAMRSRLIEKDRNFYLPLFPNDEGYNDGKYWWPVMETRTFRII